MFDTSFQEPPLSFPTTSHSLEETSQIPGTSGSTAHCNPSWLKDLKRNMKSELIGRCSLQVQEAVENNTQIENIRERKSVRNDIINTLVSAVVKIFGGVSRPRISEMRELVVEMQFLYPAMFRDDDSGSGYGLGGTKGNDGLAQHMMDRLRKLDRENQTKAGGGKEPAVVGAEGEAVFAAKRKGKRKLIYGNILYTHYDLFLTP